MGIRDEGLGIRDSCTPKRGRPTPPFQRVRGGLPFLAALLLPALGSRLLCHCAYPPFHSWVLRGLSPRCSAAAVWQLDLRCRRPRFVGLTPASRDPRRAMCARWMGGGRSASEKRGVPCVEATPVPVQAASSVSFRPLPTPSSRRPLRISSPLFLLGMWQLSC
jgi:hypothetical protein